MQFVNLQIRSVPYEAPMRALAVQGKELMNHATMCNVYKKATSIEMNLISYLGDQIQAGTLNEQQPNLHALEPYSKHLLTYMQVFGFGFVAELLPDQAAQTRTPYVILIPYCVAFHTWLGFSMCFIFSKKNLPG